MAVVEGLMPPTRENWERLLIFWQISYPLIGLCQFLISWYGMGKTSKPSMFNFPGRITWFCMEIPGCLTLLYIMKTLPGQMGITDLPWQNKVLAGLFVIHYTYRAVLFPILQPSMAPIHIAVASMAVGFQLMNATSIGAYLAAYGPTTPAEWEKALYPFGVLQLAVGIAIFYIGFASNYIHDEELREIRRTEQRRQERIKREQKQQGKESSTQPAERHYQIPEAGLFKYMLFPHYFSEWVEWLGFWMASGWGAAPARAFFVNEVFTMGPRAINGRRWYADRFGEEKIRRKWTIVPGVY